MFDQVEKYLLRKDFRKACTSHWRKETRLTVRALDIVLNFRQNPSGSCTLMVSLGEGMYGRSASYEVRAQEIYHTRDLCRLFDDTFKELLAATLKALEAELKTAIGLADK